MKDDHRFYFGRRFNRNAPRYKEIAFGDKRNMYNPNLKK